MWTQRSRNCIRTKLSISIIEQVETESGFILLFRIFVCVTQMWGEKSVLGMNQASVMQHIYVSREKKTLHQHENIKFLRWDVSALSVIIWLDSFQIFSLFDFLISHFVGNPIHSNVLTVESMLDDSPPCRLVDFVRLPVWRAHRNTIYYLCWNSLDSSMMYRMWHIWSNQHVDFYLLYEQIHH